jgi:hypothetical protein
MVLPGTAAARMVATFAELRSTAYPARQPPTNANFAGAGA